MRLNSGYPQDQMQDLLNNTIFYKCFKTIQPNDYLYFSEDIIFAIDNAKDLAKAIDRNPRMVKAWGSTWHNHEDGRNTIPVPINDHNKTIGGPGHTGGQSVIDKNI